MSSSTANGIPFDSNAAAGLLLLGATVAALAISNSPLGSYYERGLNTILEVRLGEQSILHKPLLHWINDGLMAVFFLLVGLEIKREALAGALSTRQRALLPVIAAAGGMAIPALIYSSIAWGEPVAMRGWAIPAATDIAFALGILALLGSRVPTSLKVFVTAVAVIDDLGAIIIIALFYTEQLSAPMLAAAVIGVAALAALNLLGVRNIGCYLIVGLCVWFAVLKSGVHATLAGVVVAAFIPFRDATQRKHSPLLSLEHAIQPWVLFAIMPLFAFANAGIALDQVGAADLLREATLGIALGLFAGKLLGICGAVYLALKLRLAELPPGMNWQAMLGVGFLCGIGFTMSLFIGTLAFEQADPSYMRSVRLGVLAGSFLSAVAAIAVLRAWLKRSKTHAAA